MIFQTKHILFLAMVLGSLCTPAMAEKSMSVAERFVTEAHDALKTNDYRKAIIALRQSLQYEPNQPDVRKELGELFLKFNDPLSAEKELTLSLKEKPTDATEIALGRALLMQGRSGDVFTKIPLKGLSPDNIHEKMDLHAQAHLQQGNLKEARKIYETILAQNNGFIPARYGMAVILKDEKKNDEAQSHLDFVLVKDPNHIKSLVLKSEIALDKGHLYSAENFAFKAVQLDPQNIAAGGAYVRILIQDDRLEKAEQALEKLTAMYPNHPYVPYLTAYIAYKKGNFRGADLAYMRIEKVMEDFPPALILGGVIKSHVGAYHQSAGLLNKYLLLNPKDQAASLILGNVYLKLKDYEGAYGTFRDLLKAQGGNDKSYASVKPAVLKGYISTLLRKSEYDKAYEVIQSALETSTDLSLEIEDIKRIGALLCGQDESDDNFITSCKEENRRDPLSRVLALLKDYIENYEIKSAKTLLEKTNDKDKQDSRLQILTAELFTLERQFASARTVLEGVLQKDPSRMSALELLEKIDILEDKRPDVVARLEKLHEQHPDNIDLLFMLALRYEDAGDFDKSADLLDKSQKTFPNNLSLIEERVRLYLKANKNDKAIALLDGSKPLLKTDEQKRSLGMAYEEAGAFDKSAEVLAELKDTPPHRLAMLYADAGQVEKALKTVEQFKGDDIEKTLQRVDVFTRLNHWSEAEKTLTDAIALKKEGRLVAKHFALLVSQGRFSEATAVIDEAYGSMPDSKDIALAYAHHQLSLKYYEKAEPVLASLIQKMPNVPELLNNMAWVQFELKKPDALSYAEEAFNLTKGHDGEVLDTFGWLLFQNGKKDQGLDLLQQASIMKDDNPDIGYRYAVALSEMDSKDVAVSVLKRVLELPSFFENKDKAEQLLKSLDPSYVPEVTPTVDSPPPPKQN